MASGQQYLNANGIYIEIPAQGLQQVGPYRPLWPAGRSGTLPLKYFRMAARACSVQGTLEWAAAALSATEDHCMGLLAPSHARNRNPLSRSRLSLAMPATGMSGATAKPRSNSARVGPLVNVIAGMFIDPLPGSPSPAWHCRGREGALRPVVRREAARTPP